MSENVERQDGDVLWWNPLGVKRRYVQRCTVRLTTQMAGIAAESVHGIDGHKSGRYLLGLAVSANHELAEHVVGHLAPSAEPLVLSAHLTILWP